MGCCASANAAAGEKLAAHVDPEQREVVLTSGSRMTVGMVSDSLAYCLLVAHGDGAVFMDNRPRADFERRHIHSAWNLDATPAKKGSGGGALGADADSLLAAVRGRCSLRSVVIYSERGNPLGDERVKAVLSLLHQAGARPKGHPLLLRGGLANFSRRFGFCVCGKGGEKSRLLPACPAEVLAPDWGGRPHALYLGTEHCVQEPNGIDVLEVLHVGTIINMSGKPCARSKCRVVTLQAGSSDDTRAAAARDACAKLQRMTDSCLLYGPASALAAALFLMEVLPKAAKSKDEAAAFIRLRFPAADFDTNVAQVVLSASANPGGPRAAASTAATPPADTPSPAQPSPVAPPAGGTGSSDRERTSTEEMCARFQKRDRRGAEVALGTIRVAFTNILEHPTEDKYRRLKGSNARVRRELLAYPEAVQLVRMAGFVCDGEDLVLPPPSSHQVLRDMLQLMPTPKR
mmetsp:Transcript_74782/g.124112  ORF Transcript_74782/g.124112 Transcript_74782/m.124112 type:complete len:460 (-) Transcript_74782:72-1451(-)